MGFFFINTVSASQETIDSDYKTGSNGQLKVTAVLYKDTGERDSNYDYYAIKATLQDIKYQNDIWTSPLIAVLRIIVPSYAVEVPVNHEPQAGIHFGQSRISFSYQGIGFSTLLPSMFVSYTDSTSGSYRYFDWRADGTTGIIAWAFVFEDYAEYAVGIRVPQGYKPYVYVGGQVAWYTSWLYLVFTYHSTDSAYWAYLHA